MLTNSMNNMFVNRYPFSKYLYFTRFVVILVLLLLVMHNAVMAQTSVDDFKRALKLETENPEEAFELLLSIQDRLSPEDSLYLRSINKLAQTAWILNIPEKEEKVYHIIKQVLDKVTGDNSDPIQYATLCYWAGYYVAEYGNDSSLAIQYYERAIEIRKQLYGLWHEDVAACFYSMGDIYKYRDYDFYKAEKCYEQSLQILERINSKNHRQIARHYYNLATTNRSQQDYEKALSYASHALHLVTELEDRVFQQRAYVVLANIYRDLMQFAMAKQNYQKAIELNLIINDRNSFNEDLAIQYTNLGESFAREGKLSDALVSFREAETIYNQITPHDRVIYTFFLQQFGDAYARSGNTKAIAYFNRSIDLSDQYGLSKAEVYFKKGNFYFRVALYDSAMVQFQKALHDLIPLVSERDVLVNPGLNELEEKYLVYEVLTAKAEAIKKKYSGRMNPSLENLVLDCYVKGEFVLDRLRDVLDIDKSKWEFTDSNFDLYEQIIASLYTQFMKHSGNRDSLLENVLHYFERSKAKSINEALEESGQLSSIASSDSLLQKIRSYRATITEVQRELMSDDYSNEQKDALRGRIVQYDREIQRLRMEREQSGKTLTSVFPSKSLSLEQLQAMLKNSRTSLIEYFWGVHDVYALVIGPEQISFKKIGAVDSLAVSIKLFLNHFRSETSSFDQKIYQQYVTQGYQLYRKLVEPFHKPAAQQKLHIIPDGLIAHIPFEALLTQAQAGDKINYRDLPYLLHQSSVSYGLSSVLFMRPLRKLSKDASLLAFGYTNGLMLRSNEPSPVDLTGTEAELDVLSKLFLRGTFLKGNEATKSNFRVHAPGSNIIHLAVHGTGDPEKDFSASLFFRSMPDSADDGQLHSYELFNYNLQAALAVLTACESGIGKTYKGEGMMSMANAFMVAGCDNVVMTLWKLNDQVSVNLIRIFYEQLLGGEDLDVALRNAKLNYLNQSDELTADPKLWAAPVVYGHGKPLIDKQITINTILILTAGLMLMVLIVILLKMRIQRKQVSS